MRSYMTSLLFLAARTVCSSAQARAITDDCRLGEEYIVGRTSVLCPLSLRKHFWKTWRR